MIYFALDRAAAAVKIGYSANPRGRLGSLQTGNSSDLELLGAIEGDQERERALHDELKDYHLNREWFRAEPQVMGLINVMLETGARLTSAVELNAYAEPISLLKQDGPEAFSRRMADAAERVELIRDIAREVAASGGKGALHRVYAAVEEYVCRNHPNRSELIMYCLDHRFDGIGDWWA